MNWVFQRLRALWGSRWTRRVAIALAVVGVSSWLTALAFAGHALMVGAAVIAILLLWLIPKWQVRRLAISQERRFELETEARKMVAQVIGGAAFLAGLYFTAQTVRVGQETLSVGQETLSVNQEGQITERFTKAIEQLGSEKLEVRLGGIYALERIARDSERDQGPIMEVLTAYVRENAPLARDPVGDRRHEH